jgi:hypothetical protein
MTATDPKRTLSDLDAGAGMNSMDWKKWAAIAEVLGVRLSNVLDCCLDLRLVARHFV